MTDAVTISLVTAITTVAMGVINLLNTNRKSEKTSEKQTEHSEQLENIRQDIAAISPPIPTVKNDREIASQRFPNANGIHNAEFPDKGDDASSTDTRRK